MTAPAHPFEIVHDAMALTGEAPIWDARRGTLWWLDIQGQRLLGYRPGLAPHAPVPLPGMPGLIALASDGNLVLGLEDGLHLFVPERRSLSPIAAVEADRPQNRLNDGKPDRDGRLWFGSMDKTGTGGAVGALYCRHPDGRLDRVLEGITVPNAIAIAPEGTTLYFADSPDRQIIAFDLDRRTGALSGRRVFARYPEGEKPDGACLDSEGGLWVAVIDGWRVDHFTADGALAASYPTPVARPTMPAFGGPDMRTLFVTSQRRFLDAAALLAQPAAGALVATRTDHSGLAPFEIALAPVEG